MKDNRKFNEVVGNIKESENDIDRVLKAGRLQRHESPGMTDKRLEMILGYIAGILAMILGFAGLYLFMYLLYLNGGR